MKYYFKPSFKSSRDNVKCKLCEQKIEPGQMIRFEPFMRILAHEACAVDVTGGDDKAVRNDMESICEAIDRLGETLKSGSTSGAQSLSAGDYGLLTISIKEVQSELSRLSKRVSDIEDKLKAWEGVTE